ncbi:DUF6458 family protein [Pengzhenrongella phosphoraccumulans]|jgi:hypothetical protein|uniref:DUF6458 family protein n=1 Tax=Pengzhenrongella phosphoraccumulans TaxID=3114394 RepID=UPI00388EFB0D
MGIGFSIFLLAAGAVLAFAVDATVAGLDLSVIGWILMAAGALGLVLTMVLLTPRRRRTVTESPRVVAAGPAVVAQPVATPTIATEREVRDERI